MFHQVTRYFLLDRHDLVYLKFVVEAYEGMTTLSTVEKRGRETLVRFTTLPCWASDLEGLLGALREEIAMTPHRPLATLSQGERVNKSPLPLGEG